MTDQPKHLVELANKLAVHRTMLDDMKAEIKPLQEAHDKVEQEFFDALENAGVNQIRVPDLGLFSLSDLAWPRVEDEDLARQWAEAEHPEFLTLNRQRLQTPVRERLKKGDPLPPGIGYTVTRKINWRKVAEQ